MGESRKEALRLGCNGSVRLEFHGARAAASWRKSSGTRVSCSLAWGSSSPTWPVGAASVTWFYNGRGTAEQFIKEGKIALNWTRLSCHDFVDNQVRLQLFALAYNLGNLLRRLALPPRVKHWTLTTLRDKLIKIGAKVVRHARRVVFQMAEVAITRTLFAAILRRIERLRLLVPAPT